jgi:hypothetical protein
VPLLKKKKTKGWQYEEIQGVSHYYVPYKALYEGLRAAFPDFAIPQGELVKGLDTIKKHYNKLSASYGYALHVPNSVYAALVQAWFNSRDPEEILSVTTEWTTTYPHSAVAWYFHGRVHQLSNDLVQAGVYFEKALKLEQARILPDSEWLNPMRNRLQELAE